jgi:hypothetical protein
MLAALQAIFDAKIRNYIGIFLTSKIRRSPNRGRGGQGLGLPSSGRLRNKVLALRTVPAAVCFRYHLGRGCEADVG